MGHELDDAHRLLPRFVAYLDSLGGSTITVEAALVRSSKFNKSRELPLESSTISALACYAQLRDRCVPRPASPRFFVSGNGTPIIYSDFGAKFRDLVARTGVGAGSPVSPRVHDLHTCATLLPATKGRRTAR